MRRTRDSTVGCEPEATPGWRWHGCEPARRPGGRVSLAYGGCCEHSSLSWGAGRSGEESAANRRRGASRARRAVTARGPARGLGAARSVCGDHDSSARVGTPSAAHLRAVALLDGRVRGAVRAPPVAAPPAGRGARHLRPHRRTDPPAGTDRRPGAGALRGGARGRAARDRLRPSAGRVRGVRHSAARRLPAGAGRSPGELPSSAREAGRRTCPGRSPSHSRSGWPRRRSSSPGWAVLRPRCARRRIRRPCGRASSSSCWPASRRRRCSCGPRGSVHGGRRSGSISWRP